MEHPRIQQDREWPGVDSTGTCLQMKNCEHRYLFSFFPFIREVLSRASYLRMQSSKH